MILWLMNMGFAGGKVIVPDLTDPDEIFQTRRIIGRTLGPKSDIKSITISSGNR